MKTQVIISELKRKARALLTAKGSRLLMLSGAYVIICTLISVLFNNILLKGVDVMTLTSVMNNLGASGTFSDEELLVVLDRLNATLPSAGEVYLLTFAQYFLTSILLVGFISLILKAIRHQEISIGTLLDGAPVFFKVILLNICVSVIVGLALMLLIIPGIIAAYAYSMSFHILADNPEKGVIQCMRESRRLMKGYKFKLFTLELSFILWSLLSLLPIVGYILPLWLTPYKETSRTLMYLQLKGESVEYADTVTPDDIFPPV